MATVNLKKPLNAVYLMHSLNGLASSLIGIFVPIYFLKQHYLPSQVFCYFLVYSFVICLFFFGASYLAGFFGIKKTIIASFPFVLLYVAMLYLIDKSAISIYAIAIVHGIGMAFYWFSLHVVFTLYSDGEQIGNNVGKLFAFPKLLSIFAPLAGGAIAVSLGFNFLFITAGIIYLLSLIPLLTIDDFNPSINFHPRVFINLFRNNRRYICLEFLENIREDAELIIWPIFVYLTFRNIFSIGVIGTIFSIGSAIVILLVGKYSDKIDKKKFMKIGGLAMIVIWLIRFYAVNEIVFYILTLLTGLFGILIVIPFTSIVYQLAKRDNIAEFIIFREIPIMFARFTIYSIALILVDKINYLFLIVALLNLPFLHILKFFSLHSLTN